MCLKAIAASTTAVGRQNLLFARDHIMKHWKAKTIYGDTGMPEACKFYFASCTMSPSRAADSVFMSYPCYRSDGSKMTGLEAVKESWRQCALASKEVSDLLPYPHNLEVSSPSHVNMRTGASSYVVIYQKTTTNF